MHELISARFLSALDNPALAAGDDAAVVEVAPGTLIAVSTDSHVVTPLFFPGGDIGRLAVCGTVNDVAMKGAALLCLTAGFVLEEGLMIGVLDRVVASMAGAAAEAGVPIVAGDTKVVERGKADSMYINTTGIGYVTEGLDIGGARARPGDVVLVSGTMGDHGIAVLAARGQLGFEADLQSDVAPLNWMVRDMLDASDQIRVLRDPTRGGLATTLNEIASQSHVAIVIDERAVPVRPEVTAACEMLGFDPLYVANEGKLVAVVGAMDAESVLDAMRRSPFGVDATLIGRVDAAPAGRVLMRTAFGSTRVVDSLAGELLPRIC
jgi:hydrogenase expression/formation protein HypE